MVQKCKYERGLGLGNIGHMHSTYRLSEQEQSIKFAVWFVTVCLLCSCLLNAGLLIQNGFCFSFWGAMGQLDQERRMGGNGGAKPSHNCFTQALYC